MNTILSLSAAKELKERGCDINHKKWWNPVPIDYDELSVEYKVELGKNNDGCHNFESFPGYDLAQIICDGEMLDKFFGEDCYLRTINYKNEMYTIGEYILLFLQNGNKDGAEKAFLEHTIFQRKP
jgi:hypothetical protein